MILRYWEISRSYPAVFTIQGTTQVINTEEFELRDDPREQADKNHICRMQSFRHPRFTEALREWTKERLDHYLSCYNLPDPVNICFRQAPTAAQQEFFEDGNPQLGLYLYMIISVVAGVELEPNPDNLRCPQLYPTNEYGARLEIDPQEQPHKS